MIRILFLLLPATLLMAIVSIKPREVGEHPGFSGEISASLETKRGNTEKDNYSGAVNMQYDDNVSNLVWAMVNGAYGEASGIRDTNNVYAHLRYIHKLSGSAFASELFAQAEMDEFKAIKDRDLGGGGVRIRLADTSGLWGGLFAGAGLFLEYINYTTTLDPDEHNVRVSTYLTYANRFSPSAQLEAVAYYQPKIDNWEDYIFSSSLGLEVHIYLQLYLELQLSFEHDSAPAVGVRPDDFSQVTLLKYKF